MKFLNWLFVIIGVAGLIGVRVLEDRLFYDPFLDYFHLANKKAALPAFDWPPLILSHLFRFGLNFLFTLLIVHFIFKKKEWTFQAAVLLLLVFLITLPLYMYCVYNKFQIGYLFSFYIRRFVIQPLVVLLIIPMFYYRKQQEINNNRF